MQVNYNQIGIDHNKGLDYVFAYLKKANHGNPSKIKREDAFALAEKAVIEFASTVSYSGSEKKKQGMKELIHDEFRKASEKRKNKSASNTKNLPDEVLEKMTDRQKAIMNEVFAVVNDLRMDLKPSLEKLNYIENRAKSICTSEELPSILSALAVGKHSLQYWHDNSEKWKVELGSIDEALAMSGLRTAEGGWFNWKRLAKQDLCGAILGAFTGGLSGSFWVALGSSAAEAGSQIWDHYI